MPPLSVVLIVVAALFVAFAVILGIYWLLIGAGVAVLLGLVGGVTISG